MTILFQYSSSTYGKAWNAHMVSNSLPLQTALAESDPTNTNDYCLYMLFYFMCQLIFNVSRGP
jgi:hypothetical protein